MTRRVAISGVAFAFMIAYGNVAMAQSLSQTTLKIDVQNAVEYQGDTGDPSQFASKPNITPSSPPKNFYVATVIADIVAVNGQPVKGTYVGRSNSVILSPTPTGAANAEAIADVTRAALRQHLFEILQPDGTPVGTVMSLGFSGGPAPPGAPSTERANWAIVGGTGAFLGARGLVTGTVAASGAAARAASMSEDPANRRLNGGGSISFMLHLIPMSVPQAVITANGPAIVHSSDFTLVSPSKPAAAGEILSLIATGLGPTVPEVDLGLPFPSNPLAKVNSPLTVSVNGEAADVLGAVGYPGSVDGYQVNFRMPSDVQKGNAVIQVTAAWIPGAPVSIPVQ
jgi:hypothetical protein